MSLIAGGRMYNEKFVCVVTDAVSKKILREHGGKVLLPFGTEYAIQFKNINSRRAVVSVSIDGTDVLQGQRVIVEPNETTHLEGYLDRNGVVTNKFKFIEKTAQISDHRGDKVDDGMLRIEYQFEAEKPEIKYSTTYHRHEVHGWGHWWYSPYAPSTPVWRGGQPYLYETGTLNSSPNFSSRGVCKGGGGSSHASYGHLRGHSSYSSPDTLGEQETKCSASVPMNFTDTDSAPIGCDSFNMPLPASDDGSPSLEAKLKSTFSLPKREGEMKTSGGIVLPDVVKDGITVKGAASDQRFKYGSVGALEVNKHVIVLTLAGTNERQEPVLKVVDVKQKLTCDTCGKTSTSANKFCGSCGTALF